MQNPKLISENGKSIYIFSKQKRKNTTPASSNIYRSIFPASLHIAYSMNGSILSTYLTLSVKYVLQN